MYFGDAEDKANNNKENIFAYRINPDYTVAYMYIRLTNVADDPKKIYGEKTNYDFFAEKKTFYRHCHSMERDIYFRC